MLVILLHLAASSVVLAESSLAEIPDIIGYTGVFSIFPKLMPPPWESVEDMLKVMSTADPIMKEGSY